MPEHAPTPPRHLRNLLLLLSSALLAAAAVYFAWRAHPQIEYWEQLLESGYLYLASHPWALVLALAILPGLGFPISPIIILIGIVLGPIFGLPTTCGIAIIAQTICTTWTYLLAAGPLRLWLTRYILRNRELPKLKDGNALRLALIMRITPGIPYVLQNLVLGVSRINFKTYLLVSIPITAIWTIGFILTGGAIFEGRAGLAITGVLLIIILILITNMLRKRTQTYAG